MLFGSSLNLPHVQPVERCRTRLRLPLPPSLEEPDPGACSRSRSHLVHYYVSLTDAELVVHDACIAWRLIKSTMYLNKTLIISTHRMFERDASAFVCSSSGYSRPRERDIIVLSIVPQPERQHGGGFLIEPDNDTFVRCLDQC